MSPTTSVLPGYSAIEHNLLQAMLDEMFHFIETTDWEQQLPREINGSFVLERFGNPVQFVLRLYRHTSKRSEKDEIKLLFNVNIKGTGKEKWSSADGGFFLSHGPAYQVARDIITLKKDVYPIQQQLAVHYRSTFYNS